MPPILAHVSTTEIDDLVDQIDQIRERLADTVDELVERAHPKAIAARSLGNLKAKFVDETGSPRMEKIVPLVAGAAVAVAALVVVRRLARG
jgi:hypothetical protein